MLVLLLSLTGYLTKEEQVSMAHSKPPSKHLQAVPTLSREAGRISLTASVCFLHTLVNFENVPVKIYKKLLQSELFRDHSLMITGSLHPCPVPHPGPLKSFVDFRGFQMDLQAR